MSIERPHTISPADAFALYLRHCQAAQFLFVQGSAVLARTALAISEKSLRQLARGQVDPIKSSRYIAGLGPVGKVSPPEEE